MDRFAWTNGLLEINETLVIQQRGVKLYDGDDKVTRHPLLTLIGPSVRNQINITQKYVSNYLMYNIIYIYKY